MAFYITGEVALSSTGGDANPFYPLVLPKGVVMMRIGLADQLKL